MRANLWITGLLGLTAAALLGAQAATQDKPARPATPPKPVTTQPPAPDDWMKAMMPGDAHKRLNPMVGTWDVKTTFWMAGAESQPETGTGTAVNKWILDGRWIQSDYTATWMEQPFHGIGFTGYDNAEKKYVNTWMDNMGTGMMHSTGTADTTGKVITFNSPQQTCPMTNKPMTGRAVLTFVSDNKYTFVMYHTYVGEKEFKAGEIEYTRKRT